MTAMGAKAKENIHTFVSPSDDWGEVTHVGILDNSHDLEDMLADAMDSMFSSEKNLYVALFSSELDDDGVGDEISIEGYARNEVNIGKVDGEWINTNGFAFIALGFDTVDVVSWAIIDEDDNMLFYQNIGNPPALFYAEAPIVFNVGDLNITME